MAEIPVERKSGIPWWVWLLLALIVLGLILWWASDDDEIETAVVAPVAPVTETAVAPATTDMAAAGPITDLTTILGAADRSMLVGRQVQLSNVQVQSVVGDRTFFVGPDANQTVLVVLDEIPTPGTPGTEGRYDVTQGQVVNISGSMASPNDPMFGAQPIEGLPAGTNAVIRAQSLDIVQRP